MVVVNGWSCSDKEGAGFFLLVELEEDLQEMVNFFLDGIWVNGEVKKMGLFASEELREKWIALVVVAIWGFC